MIILAISFLLAQTMPDQPSLQCDIGPVERQFGGAQWFVYACTDRSTVVVVTKSGNPAGSFYFVLHLKGGHYAIDGEGNGSKAASDAAGDAIRALGDDGVRALLAAALAVPKS